MIETVLFVNYPSDLTDRVSSTPGLPELKLFRQKMNAMG
jgi:hypothetical protein